MPLRTFGCKICGKQAPREYRKDGEFAGRMEWLWGHRKENHSWHFSRSIRKSQRTRAANRKKK